MSATSTTVATAPRPSTGNRTGANNSGTLTTRVKTQTKTTKRLSKMPKRSVLRAGPNKRLTASSPWPIATRRKKMPGNIATTNWPGKTHRWINSQARTLVPSSVRRAHRRCA
jgi:hypothetical protein